MSNPQRSLTVKKLRRKPMPVKNSPKLSGEIELLRMHVATAESLLHQAREQASRAKRRRKLAKLLAKRARKGAKQAKADLAAARAALARAEFALIMDHHRRTAKRRPRRSRPVVRPASPTVTERSATPRKSRNPARSAPPAPAGQLEEVTVWIDAGPAQTTTSAMAAPKTP